MESSTLVMAEMVVCKCSSIQIFSCTKYALAPSIGLYNCKNSWTCVITVFCMCIGCLLTSSVFYCVQLLQVTCGQCRICLYVYASRICIASIPGCPKMLGLVLTVCAFVHVCQIDPDISKSVWMKNAEEIW